jgi:tRNA-specific 2-thiouridylase
MWYYTIGQGAKVSGMGIKMFVAKKGVGEEGRDILVVPGSYVLCLCLNSVLGPTSSEMILSLSFRIITDSASDHPLLQCTSIQTDPFHWISGTPPNFNEQELLIQVRHRMKPVPARISILDDGSYVVLNSRSNVSRSDVDIQG